MATARIVERAMFDYAKTFAQRGHMYNRASERYPLARFAERALILDRLDLRAGLRVCDAPAGGGYVALGIAKEFGDSISVVCIEPSEKFAGGIDPRFEQVICPLERIDLPDESVDRVVSLAGLHHLASKQAFFDEAARILRPGGVFAAADVLDGTPVANFLNGPVNRLSETGHDGSFLRRGELIRLFENAGLVRASEEFCRFAWEFPDRAAMVSNCKDLFGLTKANELQVDAEIARHLSVSADIWGAVALGWSLLYGDAVKRT